ncbi:MAG: protein kinase [Deltaproteobacteria bacterium]|nr:protein kinase [Deltaproteobacteria bacterium]
MVGKTISHYKILEKIGEGGMGVVYKAEDTKLDRIVALKFLPAHISLNEEEKTRFIHEARAAAALNHLNIVTIHEINEFEGQTYIAMEQVEGQTLKEIICRGGPMWPPSDKNESNKDKGRHTGLPLPMDQILDIAIQITEGLGKAHGKEIIHRDIKSANIMVTGDGVVKILDFGLAKLRGQTRLTKTGTTMGTVAYMSPEQAVGETVDHRTDIWSLGVLFYEILTGQLPFRGEYDQAIIYSIMNEDPEPVIEVRPEIPISLDQVIARTLEKSPGKRYQSIDELLADLSSISEGIVPEEIKARLRKTKLRKRKTTIMYALSAALIITAVIVLGLFSGSSQTIDSIAVLPVKNLTGDPGQEYFAEGVTDELIGQLGQISGLRRVISRTSVMHYKKTDKSLSEIARDLNVDAVVEGTVYQAGDPVRIRFQLIDALPEERNLWGHTYTRPKADILMIYSEVTRAVADKIQLKLTSKEDKRLAETGKINPEAYDAYLKGSLHWKKLTPADLDLALRYFELALKKDPSYAPAYSGIAFVWMARATSTAAAELPHDAIDKARKAAAQSLKLDNTHSQTHFALAGIATWYDWDWDTAEKEFLLALKLNPNDADAHVFYGLYLTAMKRLEEATEQMKLALELDPLNFMYLTYYGVALYRSRMYDEALIQYQKGLALAPEFLNALSGIKAIYYHKGMFKESLELQKKIFTVRGQHDLIEVLEQGMAEGGYNTAIGRIADAMAKEANPAFAMKIARYYVIAGEHELALDWLEKAYEERLQNMIYLRVNPKWDPLRHHPRFKTLVKKMNYPEEK